jgi:hypothetical protein
MNEKENTFRMLKDEVPLMKSWWCRMGIHNWTMWGEPKEGVHENVFLATKRKALYQFRRCGNCNKINRGKVVLGSIYH